MDIEPWRPLTDHERAVLDLLLAEPFPGRDELRLQIANVQVRTIDKEGSLGFQVTEPTASVNERIPTEGRYEDGPRDNPGVAVEILLHVVEGKIKELEVYKVDGSDIVVGAYEVDLDRIKVWAKNY